ncbi:hypothetical protein D3C85_1322400 [compost metagenome]
MGKFTSTPAPWGLRIFRRFLVFPTVVTWRCGRGVARETTTASSPSALTRLVPRSVWKPWSTYPLWIPSPSIWSLCRPTAITCSSGSPTQILLPEWSKETYFPSSITPPAARSVRRPGSIPRPLVVRGSLMSRQCSTVATWSLGWAMARVMSMAFSPSVLMPVALWSVRKPVSIRR